MRAVIFDYGFTLVTFSYPRRELVAALEIARPWLAELRGGPVPGAETLMREVVEPLEAELGRVEGEVEVDFMSMYAEAWRRTGLRLSPELLHRILDLEQRCWEGAVVLVPGALETLDRLRQRGIATAVASNAPFPAEMMRRQLVGNGIGERLDAIVFSSEVGWRKPAPALYLAALERLDCLPADALYVGDRVVEDYEGPRRLGMRAVICTAASGRPPGEGIPTIADLRQVEDMV